MKKILIVNLLLYMACALHAQVNYTDSLLSMDFIFVKGGTFLMGQDNPDLLCTGCTKDETPAHTVELNDFYIGETEVTQAQWRKVMGSLPLNLYNVGCDECPVDRVSWERVQLFIKTLNEKTGKKFRLPTEAEWEYAAKGGAKSKGYLFSGGNDLDKVGWYYGNFEKGKSFGEEKTSHPVKSKSPNELGLYDMSGNVAEWCEDAYHEQYYEKSPPQNPVCKSGQQDFVSSRGGSWLSDIVGCRSVNRDWDSKSSGNGDDGFRLVLEN